MKRIPPSLSLHRSDHFKIKKGQERFSCFAGFHSEGGIANKIWNPIFGLYTYLCLNGLFELESLPFCREDHIDSGFGGEPFPLLTNSGMLALVCVHLLLQRASEKSITTQAACRLEDVGSDPVLSHRIVLAEQKQT